MLQNIGDKLKTHRWLAFVVLGLLALIFTLWGAYGIVDLSFGAPNYALKVNGEEVPLATVQNAWQQRQSQYQQQLKDDIPLEQRKLLQKQLLDSYVDATLLHRARPESGFRVDNAAVHEGLPERAGVPGGRQVQRAEARRAAGAERHHAGRL